MLMPYSPLKLLLMYNSVLFKCWTSNTCNLIILIIIKLQLYTCPSRGLFSLLSIDFWCLYASMIHWVHLHKVTLWFFFSCNECQDQCKPHNSRQFMFSVVLQLIEIPFVEILLLKSHQCGCSLIQSVVQFHQNVSQNISFALYNVVQVFLIFFLCLWITNSIIREGSSKNIGSCKT